MDWSRWTLCFDCFQSWKVWWEACWVWNFFPSLLAAWLSPCFIYELSDTLLMSYLSSPNLLSAFASVLLSLESDVSLWSSWASFFPRSHQPLFRFGLRIPMQVWRGHHFQPIRVGTEPEATSLPPRPPSLTTFVAEPGLREGWVAE